MISRWINRSIFSLIVLAMTASVSFAQPHKEAYNRALEAQKAKNYTQAYAEYSQAKAGAQSAGDTDLVAKCNKIMAKLDKLFGSQAYKAGDYQKAVGHFDSGIALDPTYSANYYNKGLAMKKMGSETEALALFKTAMEGKDAKVKRAAEKALRSHFHAKASAMIAKSGAGSADAAAAIAELDKMKEYVEPDADTHYYLATAHSLAGNHAAAVSSADAALAIHKKGRSDKAKIHFVKGEALLAAGDTDAAKASFAEAVYGQYKNSAQHYLDTL